MQVATLLFFLVLSSCSGVSIPGTKPSAMAGQAFAAAAPHSSSARHVSQPQPAEDNPDAPNPGDDPILQARTDCWMAVEKQKNLRNNLDGRIAYVDKCVGEKTGGMK